MLGNTEPFPSKQPRHTSRSAHPDPGLTPYILSVPSLELLRLHSCNDTERFLPNVVEGQSHHTEGAEHVRIQVLG